MTIASKKGMRASWLAWGLIIGGALTKLGFILIERAYLNPRTWEYEVLASNLLRGDGYQIEHMRTVHRSLGPPLYTFICAGIYWVAGHHFFVILLMQVILSGLLAYIVYRVGQDLFGPMCGVGASGLAVVHPGLGYYAVRQIHPLLLDTALIALVYWCALRALRKPGQGPFIALGLATGFCVLSRPTITLFLPVAVGLVIYRHRSRWRDLVPSAALCVAFASLVVLPWTIRNWQVHHTFIFITSDTGELLWRGNHAGGTGFGLALNGQASLEAMPEEFKSHVLSLDEMGQRQFLFDQALAYIGDEPAQFVLTTLRKVAYFWWFHPLAGDCYPALYLQVYKWLYGVGLAFGLVGLYTALRYYPQARWPTVLLLALFGIVCLSQGLFYVNIRHRWGIEALGGMLTVLGAVRMVVETGVGKKVMCRMCVRVGQG